MRQGFCVYCNESRLVDVPDEAGLDEANMAATEECGCIGATDARAKRMIREKSEKEINRMLEDKYPETKGILMGGVEAALKKEVKKITVIADDGKTMRMTCKEDQIKLEVIEKKKEESMI